MKTLEKKFDGNSSINQDIKGQFIAREVYCNVNSLVQAILDKDENMEMRDEWENMYTYDCPDCGHGEADMDKFDNDMEINPNKQDFNFKCTECGHYFDDEPEMGSQEIYEYWAVSDMLYKDLKAKGHPVWDSGSTLVWGRCTSGQAILLDGVITEICKEMEILEGQASSWERK